jgi:hypothetical protein
MPDISCTPKELGESQCRAVDGFAAIFFRYGVLQSSAHAASRNPAIRRAIVGVPILAGLHHQYVRI